MESPRQRDNLWHSPSGFSGQLGRDWLESPPVDVAPSEEYVVGFTIERAIEDSGGTEENRAGMEVEADLLMVHGDSAIRTSLLRYTAANENRFHRRCAITVPAGARSAEVRVRSSRPAALVESYFARRREDLGEPIQNAAIVSGVFGRRDGRLLFYTIRVGSTSVGSLFCVSDAETGNLLDSVPLDAMGSNTLHVNDSDESVYIGGYHSGKLYRYGSIGGGIEDLGHPEPDAEFTFSVTDGPDGSIIGGTWPRCRLFRYDRDAFSVESPTGPGRSFVENTNYLRGLIYDAETDTYIVGTGTPARLFVYSRGAASAGEVCTDQTEGRQFVGRLFLYGENLFVSLIPGALLVARVERADGAIADIVPRLVISPFDVRSGIAEPVGDTFFYVSKGRLMRCNLDTLERSQVSDSTGAPVTLPIKVEESYCDADPHPTLYFAGSANGHTSLVQVAGDLPDDPVTVEVRQLDLPPASIDIRTLAVGPSGEILSSPFRLDGFGVYTPFLAGSLVQHAGLGQCEGIVTTPVGVFSGVYPEARIYRWDPEEDWTIDSGGDNPTLLFAVEHGQDRPFGMAYAEGKVFAAVTPVYGSNEGALVVFDARDPEDRRVYVSIVPHQSPISLAVAGNLVCGGTSVWGGLGIQPEAAEAELFVVQADTEQLVRSIVPVEGRRAITGLLARADETVWGMNEGVLFIYDPAADELAYSRNILPHIVYDGSHNIHFDANMVEGPDGIVYIAAGGRLCSVDPETMAVSTLVESDAKLLVADRFGHLYYTTRCGPPLGGTGGAMMTRYMVADE